MNELVKKNSVVQVNENGKEGWIGCLIQVDEVREWGIQGWCKIPMQGDAYIRIKWSEFDYIGQAVMTHKNNEEYE